METPTPDAPTDTAAPDHIQAQYPDRRFFEYREFFLRHLIRDLRTRLPPQPDGAMPQGLDVGCNTGRYTALLQRNGIAARGLDWSGDLIRQARAQHPECEFMEGDAQQLPLPDASLDCLTSFGLLQCLPDWQRALAEAVRVLKPGGVALIETNRAFPLWEVSLKTVRHLGRRTLTPTAARAFFAAHARGAARPLDKGLRKFAWRDLRAGLAGLPLSAIVVHDPRKHRFFHDFMWAVTVTRGAADDPSPARPTVTRCAHCRRRGVMQVREGWE